jgi:hypothetical protein
MCNSEMNFDHFLVNCGNAFAREGHSEHHTLILDKNLIINGD